MARGNSKIASAVKELVRDEIHSLGYDIWDVEYVKEGASWYLRITIDKEGGISIDDCERVNRAIDPIIDKADPIEDSYYLEVSSTGIERVLRTREHFEKCVGEKVRIKLFDPIDSKKVIVGRILPLPEDDKNALDIETESGSIRLLFKNIAKANTVFDF